MPNNTFEDYKKAVKKKYGKEKNREHSFYLEIPTRGKLRNLCWELFQQQNRNQDDLNVFSSLLGVAFDVNKKNKFDEQKDKFRPIETFFKGETDPTNVDAVNMAAILVDYPWRPFNKFRIQELFPDEIQIDNENEIEKSNKQKDQVEVSGNLEVFLDKKERAIGIESTVEKENEKSKIEIREEKEKPIDIERKISNAEKLVSNVRNKFLQNLKRHIKKTAIGVAIILGLGFGVIYYAFWNKGCMQWNNDHYDIVDCSLKEEDNTIVILDPTIVNLKKIKVCDTTVFFKHGKAGVFYAKSANSVEYFNQMAPHPVTEKYLKPITNYMIYKYVGPCK
jgi:hypothetical protein